MSVELAGGTSKLGSIQMTMFCSVFFSGEEIVKKPHTRLQDRLAPLQAGTPTIPPLLSRMAIRREMVDGTHAILGRIKVIVRAGDCWADWDAIGCHLLLLLGMDKFLHQVCRHIAHTHLELELGKNWL